MGTTINQESITDIVLDLEALHKTEEKKKKKFFELVSIEIFSFVSREFSDTLYDEIRKSEMYQSRKIARAKKCESIFHHPV